MFQMFLHHITAPNAIFNFTVDAANVSNNVQKPAEPEMRPEPVPAVPQQQEPRINYGEVIFDVDRDGYTQSIRVSELVDKCRANGDHIDGLTLLSYRESIRRDRPLEDQHQFYLIDSSERIIVRRDMVPELAKANRTTSGRLREHVRSRLRLRDPYYRVTHEEPQDADHYVAVILVPVMVIYYARSTLDNIILKRKMYVLVKENGCEYRYQIVNKNIVSGILL